ncbi:MAG: TIGR03936 family radical SAM-associated protein [Lachnospiraceae bacterium]|nr:TIGR03936 family radical SAM-associated protein [Lachnospiraceae bacterium]
MKVRMKMAKTGPIRYVGHLDFMRSFQKALRRSGIRAAFSRGFSPHMLISFASPLGVGLESVGEYVDVELAYRDPFPLDPVEEQRLESIGLKNEDLPPAPSSGELCRMINRELPEGVRVFSMKRVGQMKEKAMALVRGADYLVFLEDGFLAEADLTEAVLSLLAETSIVIHKVTPKSESDVDIRPLIYDLGVMEDGFCAREERFLSFDPEGFSRSLFMSLSAGSAANLKPETLMAALCRKLGKEFDPCALRILRLEMYAEASKAMSELGEAF